MASKREMIKAIAISIVWALLTLIPYWIASSQTGSEAVFSGFLINPIDGFSYLAKMRQGLEGSWSFSLPYTAYPGEGTYIFLYFIFLGHLANWIGIQAIQLYHIARVLGAAMMFITAFILLSHFIQSSRIRWAAFVTILLCAGLGWIGIPFNVLASDLWIVESIPFQTAYANAHFPIASALFLGLIILMLSEQITIGRRVLGTVALSTLLAIIQPFSLFALFLFLLVWILWETWLEGPKLGAFNWRSTAGERWMVYLAMVVSALPWLIYDFSLTINHPQIAAWNSQNLTPSPPLIEFILGFGFPFILTVFGLIKANFKSRKTDRLLLVWCVLHSVLLYAPLGLQRRFSHGLYFALVPVAFLTLERWIKQPGKLRLALLIVVLLSIPSNLVVVGSGLYGAREKDSTIVLQAEEHEAYRWLSMNGLPGSVILTGPKAGNRIPAYANLRVIYGHPFETIDAEEQLELVEKFYSSEISVNEFLSMIRDLYVTYVFYGPEEKALGEVVWLKSQSLVFQSGDYSIYEMTYP
jgi:hypothetical protein